MMELSPIPEAYDPVSGTGKRRQAIIVLGASRSGTSLTTHLLSTLGGALPENLLGPAHGNPLGHWEPLTLVRLNDTILKSAGTSWNDPRSFAGDWPNPQCAHDYALKIAAIITEEYGAQPLLLLKDPRIARLVPLYLKALDILSIEPLVVLQVRDPLSVAFSLSRRDGMSLDLAEALWLRSVVEMEFHTRECRRSWLSMDAVLDNWEDAVDRLGRELGIEWPCQLDKAAPIVATYLERRPRSESTAHVGYSKNLMVRTVWQAILLSRNGEKDLAREFFDVTRLLLNDLDWLSHATITYLEEQLSVCQQTVKALHASRSWRISAPFRAVGQRVRDLQGWRKTRNDNPTSVRG